MRGLRLTVDIVLKQEQFTGRLTLGVVKDTLTKSPSHPRGIKVMFETGARWSGSKKGEVSRLPRSD